MVNLFMTLYLHNKVRDYEDYLEETGNKREGVLEGFENRGRELLDGFDGIANAGRDLFDFDDDDDEVDGRVSTVPPRSRNGTRHNNNNYTAGQKGKYLAPENLPRQDQRTANTKKDTRPLAVRVGVAKVNKKNWEQKGRPRYNKQSSSGSEQISEGGSLNLHM